MYYFDVKTEYNKAYFDTMNKLFPQLLKENPYSFISEHMLIRTDIMAEIISTIENNNDVDGIFFWEKILNAVDIEKLDKSGFSEFETYGTYATKYHSDKYCVREWHSLREGTIFFAKGIEKETLIKLSKKYDAVSLENHLLHKRMSLLFSHRVFANADVIFFIEEIRYRIKKIIKQLEYIRESNRGGRT